MIENPIIGHKHVIDITPEQNSKIKHGGPMMTKKLKKELKLWGTCFLLLAGIFLCTKTNVYGAEGRLTEEEAKKQILEIIEEDSESALTHSIIFDYDIEKLYPIIHVNLFINDYLSGTTFIELITREQIITDKNCVYWILPYTNTNQEKYFAIFLESNRNIDLTSKTQNFNGSIDMKLHEDKYKDIATDNIESVYYLQLELYAFEITYIKLRDGKELIIPYFQNEKTNWARFESNAIYDIDDFIVKMYNYYDEPTKKELIEFGKKNLVGDISTLIKRKKILNYENIQDIKATEKLKEHSILILAIIFLIFGLGLVMYKKGRKKYPKSKAKYPINIVNTKES